MRNQEKGEDEDMYNFIAYSAGWYSRYVSAVIEKDGGSAREAMYLLIFASFTAFLWPLLMSMFLSHENKDITSDDGFIILPLGMFGGAITAVANGLLLWCSAWPYVLIMVMLAFLGILAGYKVKDRIGW